MLDRQHFSVMTGGDAALQSEVVALFRGQADAWRASLTVESEPALWRETAHKLKGSARGIGLWALGEACEAAEQASAADAGEKLAAARNLLEAALAELAGY